MTVQESIDALPSVAGQSHSSRPIAGHPGILPRVQTTLTAGQVLERLDHAARRGRLPGFEKGSGESLFTMIAYGEPLDHQVSARAEGIDGGLRIGFELRMLRKLPVLFWVLTAVTVWPGVWLTDSMLRTYFDGYDFATWMWYIPLTVLPVPWMWGRWVKNSREAARASAIEQVNKVAKELGGDTCLQD